MPVDEAPDGSGPALTRRRFLAWSAASAVLAACELAGPTDRPSRAPEPAATAEPSPAGPFGTPIPTPARSAAAPATPGASPAPSPPAGRTLYRDGALADARSDRLRRGVSILVEGGLIRWIRPSDDEGDRGPRSTLEVVDASGATFVPGMVDAHSHVTLPGGAHWIDRADDNPADLLEVAERNGRLLTGAGVRWARDVGAPRVDDPTTGKRRALSLAVRDRWLDRPGFPYLRVAGTWLTRRGSLSSDTHAIQVDSADELLIRANDQLDEGADLVKLYLSGPDPESSPFTASEVERVVDAVHARGAKVTAHATRIAGARAGVRGRVDAIEHGSELDAALCREMAERGTFLVTTIALFRSWQTFARTTDQTAFTGATGKRVIQDRLERARASASLARKAGVKIAAGTDAGGGSLRANQLAWEVDQLVVAGLEPWQALAAATWRGGELLGEADAGVIREGGPADFFLVHGDPLSEPAALWRVWRVAWAN
jgi:imidazolonepropionase-like amidohydrolase